jgi:hypothetical protein
MKNTLAENLLRFGVKNLKDADKQKLMEQDPGSSKMTPEQVQAFDAYINKSQQAVKNTFGLTGQMNSKNIKLPMVAPAAPGADFWDVSLEKWEFNNNFGIQIKLKGQAPSGLLIDNNTLALPLQLNDKGIVYFGRRANIYFNIDEAGLEKVLASEGLGNVVKYLDKNNPETTKNINRILTGCKVVAEMYQKSGVGSI